MGGLGSIPGLGRSPGEGNGYPLQYSGLENSMDCIVDGVTKSQTQMSNFHLTYMKAVINCNFYCFLWRKGVTEDKIAEKAPMKVLLQPCSWKPCSLQERLGKEASGFLVPLEFN